MIIRFILALFFSGASAVCYLAGLARLMSGLLIGFGALVSAFFGILFVVDPEKRQLWFPVFGEGAAWPFFLLALILSATAALALAKRREYGQDEQLNSLHFQYCIGGFFAYLLSLFLPSLLWFPSDERRLSLEADVLGMYVLVGTCFYLVGTILSLFLFYKASRGVANNYPDLMRRVVLSLFAFFQFDKMPAFVAFLMIYSPETQIIYPGIAALALSGYIPVSFFLLKLSWQSEKVQ